MISEFSPGAQDLTHPFFLLLSSSALIYINCVVNNFDPVSMLTIQPMVILEDDPHRRLDSWGRAVTNTLTKVRGCASNVGQMPPYLSDHAAEKANLEQAVLNKPVL